MDTTPTAPMPTPSKWKGYWEHATNGASVWIVALTALGTAGGWMYYQTLYSVRYRISSAEVSLSLIDYLIAGLIPIGSSALWSAILLSIAQSLQRTRTDQKRLQSESPQAEMRVLIAEMIRLKRNFRRASWLAVGLLLLGALWFVYVTIGMWPASETALLVGAFGALACVALCVFVLRNRIDGSKFTGFLAMTLAALLVGASGGSSEAMRC